MNTPSETLSLSPLKPARRLPRLAGYRTASVSITLKGETVRLLVAENFADQLVGRFEQTGFASFPKTHTDSEYSPIISISDDSQTRDIPLSGLTATFVKGDLFPNGEILLVASRCSRDRDGSYALNASVYGLDGGLKRKFLLGDGISHVQTDLRGNIWVGYFDEGVYGNFGWQQSDNRLGAAGLSCFDKDGHKIWDYRPPEGFEFISDCYALNVSKVGPWAHYYTDFPIVSVDSHWQIRAWQSDLGGARNLAVGDRMALLYGGYGDRRTACGLLEFGDREATWIAEVSLVLPEHVDRSKALVIGRDRELHLFSGDDWYVFSVDSLDLSHS